MKTFIKVKERLTWTETGVLAHVESIRSEAIRITVAMLFPKYFKYITKMLKTQCIMHDVRKCNLKYLVENNLCFMWKLSRNK